MTKSNNNSTILLALCLCITGLMGISLLTSCGKSGVSSNSNSNARLQIVNASPGIQPFNLYAFFIEQGTSAYYYPSASGYFLVNSIDTPLQIRTSITSNGARPVNLLTLPGSLKPNTPYTWFVTGLYADSSLASVLTVDTGSTPAIGRSKIRFVNVSPGSPTLNLTANDTVAFKAVKYKDVTKFIELTAGTYNLNVTDASNSLTILSQLRNFTMLDGRLYTMYFYGLSNRADSAAYGTNIVLNSLPPGTKY
jgi:hypothetical protein